MKYLKLFEENTESEIKSLMTLVKLIDLLDNDFNIGIYYFDSETHYSLEDSGNIIETPLVYPSQSHNNSLVVVISSNKKFTYKEIKNDIDHLYSHLESIEYLGYYKNFFSIRNTPKEFQNRSVHFNNISLEFRKI